MHMHIPSHGQLVFDMGFLGNLSKHSYYFVSNRSTFSSSTGFGWLPDAGVWNPYERFAAENKHLLYELYRSGIGLDGQDGRAFRVNLHNGPYTITVIVGDLLQTEATINTCIVANHTLVAMIPVIPTTKDGTDPPMAVRFHCDIQKACLEVRIRSTAKSLPRASICGIIIQNGFLVAEDLIITQASHGALMKQKKVTGGFAWFDSWDAPKDKWDLFSVKVGAVIAEIEKTETSFAARWTNERTLAAMKWMNSDTRKVFLQDIGIVSKENQSTLLPILSIMGLDGLCLGYQDPTRSSLPAVAEYLTTNGMAYTIHYGGEKCPIGLNVSPKHKHLSIILNNSGVALRFKRQTYAVAKHVYSNFNSVVAQEFRKCIDLDSNYIVNAAALIWEEPRGCWAAAGGWGDFSENAVNAFNEAKYKDAEPLPYPSPATWKMGPLMHDLYVFRLNSVGNFTKAVFGESFLNHQDVHVGNCSYLPNMNHHCVRPDRLHANGVHGAQWPYFEEFHIVKYCAEMMVAARSKTDFWASTAVSLADLEGREDAAPLAMTAIRLLAGLSALPDRVTLYGMAPLFHDSSRIKLFIELSRLVRATSGFTHRASVYVYVPLSLNYPDLVHLNQENGERMVKLIKQLCDENIDFKITYDLNIPSGTMALYAAIAGAFTDAEENQVTSFIRKGGVFVYCCETLPTDISAKTRTAFVSAEIRNNSGCLMGYGIFRWFKKLGSINARSLATQYRICLNPCIQNRNIRSFSYGKGHNEYHLFANVNGEGDEVFALPETGVDVIRRRVYHANMDVPLEPGGWLLLELNVQSTTQELNTDTDPPKKPLIPEQPRQQASGRKGFAKT